MGGNAMDRLIPPHPQPPADEVAARLRRLRREVVAGCSAAVLAAAMVLLASSRGGAPKPGERLAVLPDQPYGAPSCAGGVNVAMGAPCPLVAPTRLQSILANVKALRQQIKGFTEATAGYRENEGAQLATAVRGETSVEEALGRTAVDKDSFVKFIRTPGPPGTRGPRGLPGPQGSSGKMGRKGFPGDVGSRGDIGAPGAAGGYGETGKTGKAGDAGMPGKAGEEGQPGRRGFQGASGARGKFGRMGGIGDSGESGKLGDETLGPPGPSGKQGPRGFPGPVGPFIDAKPELPCCKKIPKKRGGSYMENSAIGNSGFYIMANHLHKNARVIIYAGKQWMNSNRTLPPIPSSSPDYFCCPTCACNLKKVAKKTK